MDHIAIMNKSWGLIQKILAEKKTIESRWYQTKRTPWDRIHVGDKVYFKNSGEPVTARADIGEVLQFKLDSLTDVRRIVKAYGKEICLVEKDPQTWKKLPKYCILIRLIHPVMLSHPFAIDRTGFGSGAAWITVPDIQTVKKDL